MQTETLTYVIVGSLILQVLLVMEDIITRSALSAKLPRNYAFMANILLCSFGGGAPALK
jgi:hypothetical protein